MIAWEIKKFACYLCTSVREPGVAECGEQKNIAHLVES